MLWFNDKVEDHFKHPRNYGVMSNPDAIGEIGNRVCGDKVRLYLKLSEDGRRIERSSFQVHGCPTAIAASSAMTEMLPGKTLGEAGNIRDVDISEALGGYPPDKMHCCTMAEKVLKAALVDAGSITGSAAEKIKKDSLFLSVTPGGTDEMLSRLEDIKEEFKPYEKVQIILKISEELGVEILDISQGVGMITVQMKSKDHEKEFLERLQMTFDDKIILR